MPKALHKTATSIAFGHVINRLRKQREWTILTLSHRTGLNANHLSVLESGSNVPSVHTLFQLAEVFGVRASDIVREAEERLVQQ